MRGDVSGKKLPLWYLPGEHDRLREGLSQKLTFWLRSKVSSGSFRWGSKRFGVANYPIILPQDIRNLEMPRRQAYIYELVTILIINPCT